MGFILLIPAMSESKKLSASGALAPECRPWALSRDPAGALAPKLHYRLFFTKFDSFDKFFCN